MRSNFIFPFIAVALLVVSCFLPWMTIESKGITITGVDTAGTRYGKPAWFHFLWAAVYFGLLITNKVWAYRVAMVVAAFNIAWAMRNFLFLPACHMGDCPLKRIGIYLLLASAIAMFAAVLVSAPKILSKVW